MEEKLEVITKDVEDLKSSVKFLQDVIASFQKNVANDQEKMTQLITQSLMTLEILLRILLKKEVLNMTDVEEEQQKYMEELNNVMNQQKNIQGTSNKKK